MPIVGLVDTSTGAAVYHLDATAGGYDHSLLPTALQPGYPAAFAGLTSLGAGTAFTVPATTGSYSAVLIGNGEITFTAPGAGQVSSSVVISARCDSTGTLASTYRAENTGEGITAQAAGFAGSITAGLNLRTAYFLLGGVDIATSFSATLSDASATDDPITHTITGTGWYLVTVSYRAGANATTLDWAFAQTGTTGTLYLMAIAVSAAGATGAASLTISDAAQSTPINLNVLGVGDFAHYGRLSFDTVDQLPGSTLIGDLTFLGTTGHAADGGADVSFVGIPPATEYLLTIADETGYSAAPGVGYLRLEAGVAAGNIRTITASRWVPQA